MELHKIIFKADFAPAFKIFDHWGQALQIVFSNNLLTTVGETTDRKIVGEHKGADRHRNLIVEVNNVSGVVEEHPIRSLDPFDQVFKDASALTELAGVSKFLRVGARFFFLEDAPSFEAALEHFRRQGSEKWWSMEKGELVDVGIASVHEAGDRKMRVMAGPFRRQEYKRVFATPAAVLSDNAYLFDVDCFTHEYQYKTFNLGKFVDFSYTIARRRAADLLLLAKEA